jgi:exodeoxyribonuclease V alpha subunit
MRVAIEITVAFREERYRFANAEGDVIVAAVNHVDGPLPDGVNEYNILGPDNNFECKQTYRLYGFWTSYFNKRLQQEESQFKFSSAVRSQPHSRAGVIAYLVAAGKGHHFGEKKAADCFDRWGSEAVKMLREDPHAVAEEIKGVSNPSAILVSAKLQELHKTENCTIALMGLLDRRGFPAATAHRCLRRWGNRAAELIERNPYLLMQFPGAGFGRTDAMYLGLSKDPGKLKRQALCAWHAINSDADGSTWMHSSLVIRGIENNISGAEPQPAKALKLAKRAKLIQVRRDADDQVWLAEYGNAVDERFVGNKISDSLGESRNDWPSFSSIIEVQPSITEHQLHELDRATRGRIGLFTGSPGTGKTFSAAALISALVKSGASPAVCAPTGKAAVRVTEAMESHGLHLKARTVHSLLGVDGTNGGWSFRHGKNNPLPHRYIIVDEASMLPISLLSSLLAATTRDTNILFIGDSNQLAPIEHGAPLRDMIAAGIPCGELREIQRNSGRIVKACAQIRDGLKFDVNRGETRKEFVEAGENLRLYDCPGPEDQLICLDNIFEVVKELGYHPLWDTQVIVPINKRSLVSREPLNLLLQDKLNPGGQAEQGVPFRTGDKVVNTRNGFFATVDMDDSNDDIQSNARGEVYVANGEIGRVLEIEPKLMHVALESPERTVKVRMGADGGCSWDLAFALSCHKSQGSGFPVVIVILDNSPGARMLVDRSWVYTAISRAEKVCLLIGDIDVAYRACRNMKIQDRKTFLAEIIKENVGMQLLDGM